MPKTGGNASNAAPHGMDHASQGSPHAEEFPEQAPAPQASSGNGDMTTTIVTVGVVAVGVALIEVAWIPGMLIGLAAAFAPKYVPKMSDGFRPLLKQTVRGAYKMAQKTREAVAEAGEQMQDLMAEARAEEAHVASESKSATPTS
jgi:hypothetical protein